MFGWWRRRRKTPAGPGPFMHLAPGQRRRVVRAFVAGDADAVKVAEAILAAGYPARSGRHPV